MSLEDTYGKFFLSNFVPRPPAAAQDSEVAAVASALRALPARQTPAAPLAARPSGPPVGNAVPAASESFASSAGSRHRTAAPEERRCRPSFHDDDPSPGPHAPREAEEEDGSPANEVSQAPSLTNSLRTQNLRSAGGPPTPRSPREPEERAAQRLDGFFNDSGKWQEAENVIKRTPSQSSKPGVAKPPPGTWSSFRVEVPKHYPGVQYRRSPSLEDRSVSHAKRGDVVSGRIEESGEWLRVDDGRYLPMKVGSIQILQPVPAGTQAESAVGAERTAASSTSAGTPPASKAATLQPAAAQPEAPHPWPTQPAPLPSATAQPGSPRPASLRTKNASAYLPSGARGEEEQFLVRLPKQYPGIQYRRSKQLGDRHIRSAARGEKVCGFVEDDGAWLRVRLASEVLFLPIRLSGTDVLVPVKQTTFATNASGGSPLNGQARGESQPDSPGGLGRVLSCSCLSSAAATDTEVVVDPD